MANKLLDLGDIAELQAVMSVEQLDLLLNGDITQQQAKLREYVELTRAFSGAHQHAPFFTADAMAFVLLLYFKSQQALSHLCEELLCRIEEELGEDDDEDDEDEEDI